MNFLGGFGLSKNAVQQFAAVPTPNITALLGGESTIKFDRSTYYTVGEYDQTREYTHRSTFAKTGKVWGQLKILIQEIQFLTLYWDPVKVPNPLFLCVGSAVGTHYGILSKLFPAFEFHLYDYRQHDPSLKNYPKIKTFEGSYFDDNKAREYAGRNDVFFVVDIRNMNFKRDPNLIDLEQEANEKIIKNDMNSEMRWTKIIKPVEACLKFRLPYSYQFNLRESKTFDFFDGLVYRQAWSPLASTECRIVPFKDEAGEYKMRQWDYKLHEEMMFYHNTHTRESLNFFSPIDDVTSLSFPDLGINSKFDSTLTTSIICDYLNKHGETPTVSKVKTLLKAVIEGAANGKRNLLSEGKNLTFEDEE